VQELDRGQFAALQVWAPPPGSPGRYETVLLLHGNQGPSPDPTWMVGLRGQPQFANRILVVPALAEGGYEWGRRTTMRALGALLDGVIRDYPVDRSSIYLLGYSAGASRVLSIAAAMPDRFAGIAAVAGDIARPFRDTTPSLAQLRSIPILLVCMNGDEGPQTNCRLNESNLTQLQRWGLQHVTLERLGGSHQLDLVRLAPLLDRWIVRR
jgi:predicted esterase